MEHIYYTIYTEISKYSGKCVKNNMNKSECIWNVYSNTKCLSVLRDETLKNKKW